ncbi:energy-coupling factor ABC transporter ATP-binding protein [Oxynema sp. CENA135]|jgi:cobalt/nickel transport system ATP-binding protein|uniref:energy-coupling factor ABC transporter ATP-binding protein n=1 Tax=Oxynema sp. CENA135 TaxID=984206 RepID=UPI00190A6402|nr:energy-coupling factor ABC transporter ATP-binding protein [Oxynema sp. CENA135]MBK4731038.1 energy-coupling factor ABC transporter ATP-binding protein [Oxynema sp. CENA135]
MEKYPTTYSQAQVLKDLAISIAGLYFSYPDKADVLQDVSLHIVKGERVGLIGANGAGKTTLFLSICGILKPNSGNISVFDRPVVTGEFRPEIGLVFQNPNDQLFCASVWDDVAFGPQNMGLSASEVERRVQEALGIAGVADLVHRPPHHLSGGQKQMVAIAGILAMQPQLVMYDEPSANLDLRSRRRIINFLQSSPQTLLISSHDLELILQVCDRVILMDEGRIIATGKPEEIMGDRQLMESRGLEKPHSLIPHFHPDEK